MGLATVRMGSWVTCGSRACTAVQKAGDGGLRRGVKGQENRCGILLLCSASKRLRSLPVAGTSVLAQRSGDHALNVSPPHRSQPVTPPPTLSPHAPLGDVSGEGRRSGPVSSPALLCVRGPRLPWTCRLENT